MLRKLVCVLMILGVLGLSGCIDDKTVVTVDKNGAGTVVNTTYMSKAAMDMMAGMMGAMGDPKASKATPKNPLMEDTEKLNAKAAAMGEGVKFVAAKEVKKPDGSLGAEVTYSFTDINKLRIGTEPNIPSGGAGGMMKPEGADAKKSKPPITFQMEKGSPAKLTIVMPEQEISKDRPDKKSDNTQEMPPEQLMQMKQMFDGFRIRMIVKVDGEITDSNATYVENDDATGKKQVITLMDMDISSLMKDEATFKKAMSMGQIKDVAEAKEKLKDFPGLKFEANKMVDVDFKQAGPGNMRRALKQCGYHGERVRPFPALKV